MAWQTGNQQIKFINNINKELAELKGELSDEEARITLTKFFRYNLKMVCYILLGIQLKPFQEMILHGMFNRNFSMLVLSRGAGKSFIAAVYAILKIIFEPNSKIMIASSTFRASRRIFTEIERILNRKSASLAADCFRKQRTLKRSDEWIMYIGEPGEGTITAIPLSGEKIRGYRSNCLILDEFLTLQEDTVKTVLMPFLNVPLDLADRINIREREDNLIKRGKLTEEQRIVFDNTSQMIALSSASYTFEYLYQTYKLWCDIIDKPELLQQEFGQSEETKELINSNYFVCQLSYLALPPEMVDFAAVQIAKQSDGTNAFNREYMAQFVDGGDGYYSPKKMQEVTIPPGQFPMAKLIGDKDKEYILSIDSNFSNAKNADYFAMAVVELDTNSKGEGIATYVHGYQKAGGGPKGHAEYLYYILTNFNIKLVILDNAGADQFLGTVEACDLFNKLPKRLSLFEFNSDKEDGEWIDELDIAKRNYNFDLGSIMMKQIFSSRWILRANEYMNSCIGHRKLFFASRSQDHPDFLSLQNGTKVPLDLMFSKNNFIDKADDNEDEPDASIRMGIRDAYELQDFIIEDTKKQLALIQPQGGGASGFTRFDLPPHLRRQTSNNKARRDNYTALLLANWGAKVYWDLTNDKKTNLGRYADNYDVPMIIG